MPIFLDSRCYLPLHRCIPNINGLEIVCIVFISPCLVKLQIYKANFNDIDKITPLLEMKIVKKQKITKLERGWNTLFSRVMREVILLSVVLFLSAFVGYGQQLPSVKNFLPNEYKGENQNWGISQSSDKLIYVANSKGLLEFNGAHWKYYLSPNETIMRSVQVVGDLIYTGNYMEFGYWQKNELQALEYTSLSQKSGIDLIEDEEFWNIINIADSMVFQSLQRIYIYNIKDGSFKVIDSESKITKIFEMNQEVYFQKIGKGIFRINDGKAVLFLDDEVVKKNEVINIFGNKKDALILTKNDGFYKVLDQRVVKSKTFSNDFLSKVSIYDAIKLKDNSLALGTIADGLFIVNEKGEIVLKINRDTGLNNNTVLALFEDQSNNFWLGLDNGISYVDTHSPYEVHNEENGILGSVYASATHNGYLYLGTNQGLFYRKQGSADDFDFIDGTQGQVWCLKVIEKTLFCGHDSGTFIVENKNLKRISEIPGAWNIARIDGETNLLLQGNYDGLYVLEESNGSWKLRNKLQGFNNSSRYFETLENEIFVNHEYKGVFKLQVDLSYARIENVVIDSTLKGVNSGIAKYNGDLLYAYKKGIFKYDKVKQKFIKDSLLSGVYKQSSYESGKLIVDEKDNILWIFTKSGISYITPNGLTNKGRINNIPLTSVVRRGIIGYENISSLGGEKYLMGTTSGYTIVNINGPVIEDFLVHIDQVVNGRNKVVKKLQNLDSKGDFDTNQNNLKISFYTSEFNKYVSTQYQFQLIGIYDDWSDWSTNPRALFENLPHGEYTFNVKSKIGHAISNNVASYQFVVKKPWYITNIMKAIYVLGLLFLLLLIHSVYKRYYKQQRLALIAKNEKEFSLVKVQNEREIIKLKNEKLKIDFSSKSKEVAASLMSIAKKNDLLRTIKEDLRGAQDDEVIKSVINVINKSLRQNDDWELFQEAFNNADNKFLKNLKTQHPVLTPSDLKLCGYLRLNLSSKEMSELLNITPRSVEIKRYRLRKKLNLQHEDNLVNYILDL